MGTNISDDRSPVCVRAHERADVVSRSPGIRWVNERPRINV